MLRNSIIEGFELNHQWPILLFDCCVPLTFSSKHRSIKKPSRKSSRSQRYSFWTHYVAANQFFIISTNALLVVGIRSPKWWGSSHNSISVGTYYCVYVETKTLKFCEQVRGNALTSGSWFSDPCVVSMGRCQWLIQSLGCTLWDCPPLSLQLSVQDSPPFYQLLLGGERLVNFHCHSSRSMKWVPDRQCRGSLVMKALCKSIGDGCWQKHCRQARVIYE